MLRGSGDTPVCRWVGELHLSYDGPHRRRVLFYGGTQAEALAELTEAKRRLADGRAPADSEFDLGKVLARMA